MVHEHADHLIGITLIKEDVPVPYTYQWVYTERVG